MVTTIVTTEQRGNEGHMNDDTMFKNIEKGFAPLKGHLIA